ncbi:MAG: glycosyltransferase family 39 protein [Anaerolineae bacterium]|jgi:hypothetical protein
MTPRRLLALLLAAYAALGIIYSLATPPLEASDEFKHYPYVQYVQTHRDLPILDPETCLQSPGECPWLQDGGQPPAYHTLMAALTSWIDTSDLPQVRWMNWHAFIGNPTQLCNKNLVIHLPERERFPWQGSVLAIHLIRLLTVGIGAGTVTLTYLLARELFPDQSSLALGAAAMTAFNPMFLFVNAAVNNDALAALLGCLNLLLFVRLARDGLQGALPIWRYALAGLTVGLFVLTKLSGLGALALLACLLAWLSYRRRTLRPLLVGLPLAVGIAALISGWWFLRNWRIYGDPTALNVFVAIQGRRAGVPSLHDWLSEFGTFRWTYWGLFGAVDVMAPRWVYTFFDLLSLVGLSGLAIWIVRRRGRTGNLQSAIRSPDRLWWIPALWAGILFISVLRWTWIYFSFQGRLIFPDIGGISTLLMVGLRQWSPRRYRRGLTVGISVLLLVIAGAMPFVSIIPAYTPPEPLSPADVPVEARINPVEMGSVARLVGWELERDPESAQGPQTVRAGESVEVVVYWRSVAPDDRDYLSFVRLLGRGRELVGQVNRYPACGMVPTSLWRLGQVWRDPYRVPVARDAQTPTRLLVEVGLYDPEEGRTLGTAQVGELKLAPPEPAPQPPDPLAVDLADGISLRGYDLQPESVQAGETVTLTLYWEAAGEPSRDYTIFIHVLDPAGEPVLFGDAPPLEGDYPTAMWVTGEAITDPHRLALPTGIHPGQYRLVIGMYDLETMTRLERLDGAGDTIEIPSALVIR